MGNRTVLLIDDDASVRRAVARYLKASGNTVIEAGSADEALRIFAERRADIAAVVTDKDMGDDNEAGIKVVAAIRDQDKNLPIVMISGTQEEEAVVKGKLADAGGAEFMVKMGPGRTLTERLEDWLDTNNPRQQERRI